MSTIIDVVFDPKKHVAGNLYRGRSGRVLSFSDVMRHLRNGDGRSAEYTVVERFDRYTYIPQAMYKHEPTCEIYDFGGVMEQLEKSGLMVDSIEYDAFEAEFVLID